MLCCAGLRITHTHTYITMSLCMQDVVGFTVASQQVPAQSIMNMLGDLYARFDELANKLGVYKVRGGLLLLYVGGLPACLPAWGFLVPAFLLMVLMAFWSWLYSLLMVLWRYCRVLGDMRVNERRGI